MNKNVDKEFYRKFHDKIDKKRYNSPYPIRRRTHREMYESILVYVNEGERTLDAGCGEGHLSFMMAEKGANVVGIDISEPNVETAIDRSKNKKLKLTFMQGDSENLEFADNSFDCVVSNHVLEHLPSFDKGIEEIYRVTKDKAIIAVPTCLNLCSWSLLGHDDYWKVGKRTLFSFPYGVLRVLIALILGKDGVDEKYAGGNEHIFRFPWVVKKKIERAGFKVVKVIPQSLCIPYINIIVKSCKIFKYFGLGTVYVVKKERNEN